MAVKGATIAELRLRGFDGGLNLRDVWAELAPNESPLCYNVIFDERGAVGARLGITALNGSSLLPQPPGYLYYSAVADKIIAYISSDAGNGKLYSSPDGITWTAEYTGFTAGAKGAIVDFNGRVVVVNTLDGVYSFPSTLGSSPTHTAGGTNNMDEARGSCIVAWKNHIIVGGDPRNDSTHSLARLAASAIADETTWNDSTKGSWFVDMREIDDQPLTCLGAGQGVDINQKPSLLVCKKNSCYRVHDESTGSFTTLHSSGAGAAGPNAICSLLGRIVFINDVGIWVTDGIATPQRVSDRISPLFQFELNLTTMPDWASGVQADRAVFNVARSGSNTNNFQIEYHPLYGWITVHKGMNLGPMTVYTKNARRLIGASSVNGKVYRVGTGGTDDGTAISTFWSSKDYSLMDGREVRLRNLRAWGRGSFQVGIRTDYNRSIGDQYLYDFSQGASVWDVDQWDAGAWGDIVYVSDEAQPLDQVCRNVQIAVSSTVASSSTAPKLLDDGVSPETGAWGFYESLFQLVPVGLG